MDAIPVKHILFFSAIVGLVTGSSRIYVPTVCLRGLGCPQPMALLGTIHVVSLLDGTHARKRGEENTSTL
eukprot:4738406-Pyramimonas_sp.AAC.1